MENTIQVLLVDHCNNHSLDLDLDPNITAFELFSGLNSALGWGADLQNSRDCYLSCENPIVLLRGNQTLQSFGVRNGSTIHYVRY